LKRPGNSQKGGNGQASAMSGASVNVWTL
jgi:hypothetical protein